MRNQCVVLAVALACAWIPSFTAEASSAGEILRVEVLTPQQSGHSSSPLFGTPRLPKFTGRELFLGGETVLVCWDPPAGGVEAGSSLLFEYRREADTDARRIKHDYSFPVTTPQRTELVLKDTDAWDAGHVLMWKVRIIRGGGLVAEKSSPNWR